MVNLRKNIIFPYFPKIPISVIMKIIELFIITHKNSVEIKNAICDFYNIQTINMANIYKIIGLVKHTIAHHLKEFYIISLLAIRNANDNIAVDEAPFCHSTQNQKIWVVGLISTRTKYFRIEASNNIEKIIRHNISEGNNIMADGFTS